jgi:hypothetical protein
MKKTVSTIAGRVTREACTRAWPAGIVVRAAWAFTVIELLVAIAAVAIVTVGLAAIFDAVGKTVQGGRRLSVLTQYGIMVENEIRQDLAALDPSSFIVIRQQFTDGGVSGSPDGDVGADDSVELFKGAQASGAPNAFRPRRVDEMVFFRRGDFSSMRPAIVGEPPVRSREARVYYGMGQRMVPAYAGVAGSDYSTPDVAFRIVPTDASMPRLGRRGSDDSPEQSVNRYASEWTLLRQVTLLQQPAASTLEQPSFSSLGFAPPSNWMLEDKDGQIGLQPAAATLFRGVNLQFPRDMVDANYVWSNGSDFPTFATGTVDICTTDLAEIRAYVVGMAVTPFDAVQGSPQFPAMSSLATQVFSPPGRGMVPGSNMNSLSSVHRMHVWMSDAMPTQSLILPPAAWGSFDAPATNDPPGRRIRYELQPVGMRGALEVTPVSPVAAVQSAYQRAAQVMLTSHNFVPRCSEFIVEWSFGRTHPVTNQLIWHGPPRDNIPGDQLCFYPFGGGAAGSLEEGWPLEFLYDADPDPNIQKIVQDTRIHPFTDRLIYGETPGGGGVPAAVTSYFGYFDPTYNPAKPFPNAPGDEKDGRAADPSLAQWPRPKLIRVTLSLSDPRDPSLEETFQFVLEVPQTRSK